MSTRPRSRPRLMSTPAILSSCVIGLPHHDLGNQVHALVQLRWPVGDAELLSFLGERLARLKVPRSIERVDRPLRDDAGKVRRSALRAERLTAARETGACMEGEEQK